MSVHKLGHACGADTDLALESGNERLAYRLL
jgi:hypothetical protein